MRRENSTAENKEDRLWAELSVAMGAVDKIYEEMDRILASADNRSEAEKKY